MSRISLYTILGLGLLAVKLARPQTTAAPVEQGHSQERQVGGGWHPQEDKHRRQERRYWFASFILTLIIAVGAGASAIYAYKAATEAHEQAMQAHEQAMQAHRQADIAEDALATSTRARLKIVSIEDASVTQSGAVFVEGNSTVFTPQSSDVVWFNFEPHYRNYGLVPAQSIVFSPRIFVVGTGHTPSCQESETGWMATEGTSAEVVFPQDDGGKQWVGVQVPLAELRQAAAKIRAIQPSSPIYLGVVGCLSYQSSGRTGRTGTYVTEFSGDLQRADSDPDLPDGADRPGNGRGLRSFLRPGPGDGKASIYDIITSDPADHLDLKIRVKILAASAD